MRFILILITILFCNQLAMAQESDSSESWSGFSNELDNLDYGKPITDKEFNDAIDIIEGKKKDKKKKRKQKKDFKADFEEPGFYDENNKKLLLRLSNDIYYDDVIIEAGFYHLDLVTQGENNYLIFKQGVKDIAKIKMLKTSEDICSDQLKCVNTKKIKGKYLKLEYKDIDNKLVNFFYIIDES